MEVRRLCRWIPLGVGILVLAACLLVLPSTIRVAREVDRTPRGQPAHPYLRPLRPFEDYVLSDAPAGLHGRADWTDARRYMTILLRPPGIVYSRGRETSLDDEGPDRLREDLRAVLDRPGLRRPDGHSEIPVLLAAERFVACRHVRAVLDLLAEPAIGVNEIRWEVRNPTYPARSVQAARRLAWDRPDLGAPGFDVRLAAGEDEENLSARLQLGARTWRLSMVRDDADPIARTRAEEVWTDIAAALDEAAAHAEHARILLRPADDRLAWGHLARLIDALLGAGVSRVDIPSWGLALDLDVPPPVDVPEPRSDAAPVFTPWVLAACALAVLLAFAITFLPRQERRMP